LFSGRSRLAALVLVAVVLVVLDAWAVQTTELTGDEPHYLLIVQSLLLDGDLDLRNNYERGDYYAYYDHDLLWDVPTHQVIVRGERWYPDHGIGLPILAIPFFALAGREGVIGLQTLTITAGLAVLWSLLRRCGFQPRPACFATLVAGFTVPMVPMSAQIFPEVPAFLLVSAGLWAALAPTLQGWVLAGLLVSLAGLPWLHFKYVPLAAAVLLTAALVRRSRRSIPALTIAAAMLAVSTAAMMLTSPQWTFVQRVVERDRLRIWTPLTGLTGLLLDQQVGLFAWSPVYLLVPAGLLLLWQRDRYLAVGLALVFASVYIPAGSYPGWRGGASSPARYLIPVAPVLALAMAAILQVGAPRYRVLFTVLAVPSLLLGYAMVAVPSLARYGYTAAHQNYFVYLLEQKLGWDLTWLFPYFRSSEPVSPSAAIYLVGLIGITIFLVPRHASRAEEPAPKPRPLQEVAGVAGDSNS
jgi:hypothetical protein